MAGYAKELPRDKQNNLYPALPATISTQSQSGVPLVSSVITLSVNTTVIDVTVLGPSQGSAAIIGKWGPSSVSGTNFDWTVQAGQARTFVVPQSVAGTQSIAGINVQMGLYNTVSVKIANAQSASIFSAEY